MAKIGRNDRCPCNSGKKYKHCCARNPRVQQRPATPDEQLKVSLMAGVQEISMAAEQKIPLLRELGVFVLFSTANGNAWLFEVTQSDCVQLVREASRLPVPIDENPKTIEIEWSHIFDVVDRQMILTAYSDRSKEQLLDCPVQEVSAAIKRIRKKIPASMLDKIHIDPEQAETT